MKGLLRALLPGFAPILLYIAVDAFWGETAGLVAGLVLGAGEFLFLLGREKRVDAFVLGDTLFLGAMGGVSLALSDPVYFRLKPAVSGAAAGLLLLAGSLGPRRFFLPYLTRKTGMGALPAPAAERLMRMVAGLGALTLAHSALTAAAALWWSKAAWDFVAGVLFWLLYGAYAAAWTLPALIARRRALKAEREGTTRRPLS